MLTNSLFILKAKQLEPVVNLTEASEISSSSSTTTSKNINNEKAKHNNHRSNIKKVRAPTNKKQQRLWNQGKIILDQDELNKLYVTNLSEGIDESD